MNFLNFLDDLSGVRVDNCPINERMKNFNNQSFLNGHNYNKISM